MYTLGISESFQVSGGVIGNLQFHNAEGGGQLRDHIRS
jgi:hypothetical protein